jgi:hypothetical protein
VIRRKETRRVLLVNPWIHDFAAYDFWQKPLGLLYIGAVLKSFDYEVSLLDCLDRYNPAWQSIPGTPPAGARPDGSGKYWREEVAKPEALAHVPRRYCRYGAPYDRVEAWLQTQPRPDVILLTSYMTYWYPSVAEMAALLRRIFPDSPLILGGIYATLCPDHAQQLVQPDYLITGEGEAAAAALVGRLCHGEPHEFDGSRLDGAAVPIAAATAPPTGSACTIAAAHRRRSWPRSCTGIRGAVFAASPFMTTLSCTSRNTMPNHCCADSRQPGSDWRCIRPTAFSRAASIPRWPGFYIRLERPISVSVMRAASAGSNRRRLPMATSPALCGI